MERTVATANPHLLTLESRALLAQRMAAVRKAAQTRRVFEDMAAEVRTIDRKLVVEAARRSPNWPFARLTEQQMRERAAMQSKAQADALSKWPEALL